MDGKKRILLLVITAVLASSAVLKLLSLQYVTGVLFALLPVAWLDTFIASHLVIIAIGASVIELLLAIRLWTRWQKQSYQWVSGVSDCACFGSWLQVPVEITFFKTLALTFVTAFLLNLHQGFGNRVLLMRKS